jgi:chromate transporter
VILNLAMFFAYHVFWPRGFEGAIDWLSVGIAAAAAIALFRFKLGTVTVVLASGVMGVLLKAWLA